MEAFANAMIFIHFSSHLLGALGVLFGLIHSNEVHGRKPWKLVLMVMWTLFSIIAMYGSFYHHSG